MFDNPIFFLILISIISGISEWLGKRRKAKQLEELQGSGELELDDDTEKQQRREEVREQQEDWEDRLRRMLAGEDPDEKPPARRAEAPSGPTRQPEPVVYSAGPAAKARASQRQSSGDSHSAQPSLSHSIPARATAPKVSEEVRRKAAQLERMGRKKRGRGSAGNRSTIQKFTSRSAARNAIMAAVVLGPAKGVGEESDILKL